MLCLISGHANSRSSPENGVCSVLTWAERWGQDVLIYNACYCDLQQQSNCCGDKRKQSAAHPHTAGYCGTKDDYLRWYKKQLILFLKLKINLANIYSKHLNRLIQSDTTMIVYVLFYFLLRQDYCCYLWPQWHSRLILSMLALHTKVSLKRSSLMSKFSDHRSAGDIHMNHDWNNTFRVEYFTRNKYNYCGFYCTF